MNNTENQNKEAFVSYIIIKADEQRDQEIWDLTDLILKNPNDGDLGKVIRKKFLKIRK